MTVRKRKDTGRWISDFYYNGERVVKTLKFARTKKEAEQAEAVIMNQVFQQAYGFESKHDKLFENFVVESFLPYSEANKKSFYYDVLICRILVQAFSNRTLRQITPPMIEAVKQELLNSPTKHGRKRSPATVNRHLAVLSKIFSLAEDADLVDSNPCKRIRKFQLDNQRMRVLSLDEERRLFSALGKNKLVKHIVLTALHTGMRRGEIFDLKWLDVDFDRGLIQVRFSKSNKRRFIPINETVRSLLESLERKSEFVFPSPKTNNRLNQIKTSFRKAVERAGILDFRFHDLRHTAASRMAESGTSPFTLMRILGHSDIRMTSRYTHATDRAIRKAVENLDANSRFGNESATKMKEKARDLS